MVTNQYYEFVQANNPLSLDQAKAQLRVELDFVDDDQLIQSYIDASKIACSNFMNRSIDRQNFIMEANSFTTIIFEPNNDNDAIEKIEYYPEGSENMAVMDPADYKLISGNVTGTKTIKFIKLYPLANRLDAVTITINQGYPDDGVPTPVIQAMKLMVSDMYERREDREIGNNSAANSLLRPYRKW